MRAVNLLPRDAEVARSRPGRIPVFVVVGVVVAVTMLAGLMRMQASSQVTEHRGDLELAQASLARAPSGEQEQQVTPGLAQERNDRLAALRTALSTRVPVDGVLAELSYVIPDDVWLTGLTVTIPADVAGATPPSRGAAPASTVSIEGTTYSQASIARFLGRLGALSSLANPRLTESTRVDPAANASAGATGGTSKKAAKRQKVVFTFTVTADLAQGARS